MNIAVIGAGYVGLVSGVCLAAKGHRVICVDLQGDIVDGLNRGQARIHEKGLPELLAAVIREGTFQATTDLNSALSAAEVVFVAVGTPSVEGRIDLRHVESAVADIGRSLRTKPRHISVVIKSTVIPGSTDTVIREVLERVSGLSLGQFGLGMNPEFLREGAAVEDFMSPDRIVLGAEDDLTRARMQAVFAPWNCDKLAVSTRTAEFIKYANNCLLATQISAINELANLAAALGGANIGEIIQGVTLDRRWNPPLPGGARLRPGILSYLVPGCGFGGSCFPKDVQALRSLGQECGVPMRLLEAVLKVNQEQPRQVLAGIMRNRESLDGQNVLILGLAFKEGTDDLRESMSRTLIKLLMEKGAAVAAHDPVAIPRARVEWADLPVRYVEGWEDEAARSDVIVIATRWNEYRHLAQSSVANRLAGKTIFDARAMFGRSSFPRSDYLAIGDFGDDRRPAASARR